MSVVASLGRRVESTDKSCNVGTADTISLALPYGIPLQVTGCGNIKPPAPHLSCHVYLTHDTRCTVLLCSVSGLFRQPSASPDDDDILSWPPSPSPSPACFSFRSSNSRGEMGSGTAQAAFAPVASSDSTVPVGTTTRSDAGCDQSLVSWLVPTTGTALRKNKKRSARPTQGRDDAADAPYASRDWAEFSRPRGSARDASREKGVGSGELTTWLKPREPPRGKNKRARRADGGVHLAATGHRSSGQSDEEGEEDKGWMSGRLEGLDPGGEAR